MPDWLIGVLIVVAGVTLWVAADFLPGPVQPTLARDGIRIRLFGFVPLLHIPFGEIAEIRRASWPQLFREGDLTKASRFGVRVFSQPVVIERVGRAPVLVAPRDPDGFVREVKQRLALPAA